MYAFQSAWMTKAITQHLANSWNDYSFLPWVFSGISDPSSFPSPRTSIYMPDLSFFSFLLLDRLIALACYNFNPLYLPLPFDWSNVSVGFEPQMRQPISLFFLSSWAWRTSHAFAQFGSCLLQMESNLLALC